MKFKLLGVLALMIIFMSCGDTGKNNKKLVWNPAQTACDSSSEKSLACLPSAMWYIVVSREDFPRNAVLNLNGYSILDECSGSLSTFNVMRGSVTNIIAENYLYIPKDQKIELEIIDRGSNCLGNKVYYLNKNQTFFTENFEGQWYVDIALD